MGPTHLLKKNKWEENKNGRMPEEVPKWNEGPRKGKNFSILGPVWPK